MSKIKYAKIEKSAYDVANLAFTLGKHCEQAIEDNKKTDSKYIEEILWEILKKLDIINNVL